MIQAKAKAKKVIKKKILSDDSTYYLETFAGEWEKVGEPWQKTDTHIHIQAANLFLNQGIGFFSTCFLVRDYRDMTFSCHPGNKTLKIYVLGKATPQNLICASIDLNTE